MACIQQKGNRLIFNYLKKILQTQKKIVTILSTKENKKFFYKNISRTLMKNIFQSTFFLKYSELNPFCLKKNFKLTIFNFLF